ncbi:hypothetical protein [uncultured Bacteroides sp.]|uniref:hypothetical protein n=1 Tax=uncultured Bacteroides sp. TaxID=162156 RepID=UPI002AA6CDB1|nr:hypothetical protein [uncultured Bacteroides sp.]
MEIKKLTKAEIDEGLTIEFVNKINLKMKSSPVMFKQGDESVLLLQCSKGFWVKTDDGYLKDEKGRLIVFDEKKCQIARARYLLIHGEEEKALEAEKLLEKRKKLVWEKLEIFKKNIEDIKQYKDPNSTYSLLVKAFESDMSEEERTFIQAKNQREIEGLPKMEKQYNALLSEFEKGNIEYLLAITGIEKRENPITFKFDNEDDMRIFKTVFSKSAMESMNYDTNKMFARLDVERKY